MLATNCSLQDVQKTLQGTALPDSSRNISHFSRSTLLQPNEDRARGPTEVGEDPPTGATAAVKVPPPHTCMSRLTKAACT
jgi:hypothetical protein